jgi:hypothetical protein
MGRIANNVNDSRILTSRQIHGRSRRALLVVATSLATTVLLAACSSAETSPSPTPTITAAAPMSAAQKAAVADGKVTYAEYQAGFRRYVACEAKAGYIVSSSGQLNEVYQYLVPAPAVKSGVDARCYASEFKEIDTIWQLSRADTSPQAAAYRVCLIKAGITPAKTETEMYFQLRKAKIDPTKCYESQQQ